MTGNPMGAEPLVSDERLYKLAQDIASFAPYYVFGQAEYQLRRLRAEYEAKLESRRPAPTDDIRELLGLFVSELYHRPSTRPLVERVRLWLDSLSEEPTP